MSLNHETGPFPNSAFGFAEYHWKNSPKPRVPNIKHKPEKDLKPSNINDQNNRVQRHNVVVDGVKLQYSLAVFESGAVKLVNGLKLVVPVAEKRILKMKSVNKRTTCR